MATPSTAYYAPSLTCPGVPMKALLSSLFLLTVPFTASAGPIPHGHEVPGQVGMFEFIRLTKAVGNVKGEGCEAALKAAYADLDRVMGSSGATDVIAVWTLNERQGWDPVREVACEDNGKKQSVKIEAVTVKAGQGPAYSPIAGSRVLEILKALQGTSNLFVAARIQAMRTVDYGGELYYVGGGADRKDVFSSQDNRNTRAVVVFREDLLPQMQFLGELLTAVPEFKGAELSATAQRLTDKGEQKAETFIFRVGTEAATSFFRGEISEQEFISKGAVLFTDGGPPVKIDISFVDAQD